MAFTRARALQSLQNGLRSSSARPALRSNTFRRAQLQAKRFASSEHGHQQSSDLPWLLGALIVTPPSVYYLWPSAHSDDHHDSHDSHDSHAKPEEKEHGDDDSEVKEATEESAEEPVEESKEQPAEKKDDAEKDKPAKESKDESPPKETTDGVPPSGEGEAKPKEKSGNVEGVNFKGKVKKGSDADEHSVKVEDDNKGGKKKRLDSGLAKNLTPGHEQGGSDIDQTTQDGKQKGISNTQTRHSEQINESSEKSTKADGTPETSKHMGTVDPAKIGVK